MKRRLPKLTYDVLRIRDFRLLMLARVFTFMALQAQAVIVGWQIYSITKDPLMLGLAGLAEALPALVSAIFAGHIVDNSRPQRIYLICIGVLAINTLALMVIAGGYVETTSQYVVMAIFIGVFISGIARAFAMPSSFSLIPQVVPRQHLAAAAAWTSSGYQIGTVGAPAIAGLLYNGYGPAVAWLIPAALLTAGVAMMAAMSLTVRQFRNERKLESVKQSIGAGWAYIWSSPVILSVMALDMFAVLLGGAVALLPIFAADVLHVGAQGLGLLRAAPAIGSMIVGLTLALFPLRSLRGPVLLAAVAGFGLSIIGFGLSTSFALSMFFLALSGGFDNVSMVMRSTILQVLTPAAMRGRVSGINSMFIISSNEIGAFESGLAAKIFGLVPGVVLGGIGTLVVVAATACLSPQLRRTKIEIDATLES